MKIQFTPQSRFDSMRVRVSGDVLIINGEEFDFSLIAEGDGMRIESPWFAAPVHREAGVLHVALIYPYQEGVTPRELEVDVENGDVEIPCAG